jgi:hypothetical protein
LRLTRTHRQDGAVPNGERKVSEENSKGYLTEKFSPEAGHYEDGARIEDAPLDLYRQVDTEDFVFAEREASSPRGVAPPPWKHLSADAYQNSSQSRI